MNAKRMNGFKYLMALSLIFAFGCEKKDQNLRAKGGGLKTAAPVSADPAGNARAQQQAAATGVGVTITDVFYPEYEDGSSEVLVASDLEIKTPQVQTIPVTTRHNYSGSSSVGQVSVGSSLVLKVSSLCEGEGCNAYYLLTSLELNGTVQAQSVALSFACDDFYFRDAVPREKFMRSVSDVKNFYSGKTQQNDCSDGNPFGGGSDDPPTLGGF